VPLQDRANVAVPQASSHADGDTSLPGKVAVHDFLIRDALPPLLPYLAGSVSV
jgi:hypothetical protein